MSAPALEPLFELEVAVRLPLSLGPSPDGEIRLIQFERGRFSGPGLQGVLLPGGSDWQPLRADGVLEIRAHYLLETDAGERIEVVSEGIRHGAPGQVYFRTFVRLRSTAPRLAHLNRRLALAFGERRADSVHLNVYAVP